MKHHFHDITISNFRGFDYLKLEDFARLNVFVGANNVGKTSILEALFMLVGMSNPLMPQRINYWRMLSPNNNIDSTRYIFHNLNFGAVPVLLANMDEGIRKLTFSPLMTNDANSSQSTSAHSAIRQLNFDYDIRDGEGYSFHSTLFIGADGNIQQTVDSGYTEKMNCIFIPADKNDGNATSNYATLVRRNMKEAVIEAIRSFDPSIETIEALPDGLYLKVAGVEELLPISMAGDGTRRMINILSSIAIDDYPVVLIDEFDNGLHYTAHRLMWKAVLKFIVKHDIQLFVTTHNLDCLQGLKNAMQEEPDFQDLTHVYNIAKTKNKGYQAYKYAYAGLKEAIDNEIEIRR